jgi:HAD superfamily hydrolase (TIGR01509 family)
MIYDYKLYIFDLDGTIIDSEYSHYEAYNLQLINKISFSEYEKIFHDENKKKSFLIENNICKIKKEADFINIYNNKVKFIDGFEIFFNELIEKGKDIIIITNSSIERMKYILSKHLLLKKVTNIITKNDMKKIKPDPECYINIINKSKYNVNEMIVFEDSYTGYKSLEFIDIEKVFICNNNYYYYSNINSTKYNNFININDIFKPTYNYQIENQIKEYNDNYAKCIIDNKENLFKMHNLLKCLIRINKKNLYFIGVGKSNLVAKKNASTWRSLGFCVHDLDCEDIWHGGFGIFNEESLIIYLSNSGNTIEIINIAKHIQHHFKSTTQIALTCSKNSIINEHVDYTFNLTENLQENGNIRKAPTISSFIFMSFLDTLGIIMTNDNINSKKFITYHPGGSIGQSNKIDFVIISCCGKGTRLSPITNHIPKSLVNIGNDNILTAQIKYWSKYTDNFIIIIDKKYNNIIDYYFKKYNVNYKIKNVEINNNEENAYTLQKATDSSELIDKSVIITWCDILMTDEIPFNNIKDNIIFTYGDESRYYCEKNKIYKRDKGNVIGCFYIHRMKKILNNNIKNDICDVFLENFNTFNVYELSNLIDVGDMNKLNIYFDNFKIHYKTRFFNMIEEIDNSKLKKTCIDEYGKELIRKEIKYYKYTDDLNLPFPKIFNYGNDFFIMEKKINYKNISNSNISENIIREIIKKLNIIHNVKTKTVENERYNNDIKIEFYDKIINRLNEINPLINFIKPEKVNNISINNDIVFILNKIYKKIVDKLQNNNQYNLIHGDCQFSNILYNESNNDICFIDPRGYYGNTFFYGIKEYDYSKLLYALSGYDDFNNDNKYYFSYENSNLNTNINYDNIFKYKYLFEEYNIDFELSLYMIIIHWIGLASYNKNNINKCISAYYQGLFLYNYILHE